MERLISGAASVVIIGFLAGLFVYGLLLLAYVLARFWQADSLIAIQKMLDSSPAYTFGLPISAAAAFALVTVLEWLRAHAGDVRGGGELGFKAFGLEFTGPAGPVTLWVICFLSLVGAIRLLRP